jgi:hypothetical protein
MARTLHAVFPEITMRTALTPALLLLVACSDYKLGSGNDVTYDTADVTDPSRPDDQEPGGDDTDYRTSDDTGWGDGGDDGGGDGSVHTDDTGDAPSAPGQIAGRICDPSGSGWVVGAEVYISIDEDGDGVEDYRISTTTDADGNFLLEDIPPGTYTVHVEKGSFTTSFVVEVIEGVLVTLPEPECLDPSSINVAVITGEYDEISAFLDALAVPYDTYEGAATTAYFDLILDPVTLSTYDIVFINCGDQYLDWWVDHNAEVQANLYDYVYAGGSIYASDWAYPFVELSWPGQVDWYESSSAYADDAVAGAALAGDRGDLTAAILDANMQAIVGSSSADLHYDLNAWALPESAGAGTTTLVQGDAPIEGGGVISGAPLALEFTSGAGRVIYTTFHNEGQATLHMELLLMEIILSL